MVACFEITTNHNVTITRNYSFKIRKKWLSFLKNNVKIINKTYNTYGVVSNNINYIIRPNTHIKIYTTYNVQPFKFKICPQTHNNPLITSTLQTIYEHSTLVYYLHPM